MNEITLKIKTQHEEIEVGKIVWSVGPPGEYEYKIPQSRLHGEESIIQLVGLQYYEFSSFLLLIEFSDPSFEPAYFFLDTEKLERKHGSVHFLTPMEGGCKEFNKLAATYIKGN